MSSWRFHRSSSARSESLPQATHPHPEVPHGDDVPTASPPRYFNLASLEEALASPSHSSATPPDSGGTVAPASASSRFSAATLTNPPRYSTLSQNSRTARDGANVRGGAVPTTSEYAFDITAGFKSERWATLRLYDERSSASRAARKTRHPSFSNMDTMLGSVDLRLPSPQTIRNISLKLKGSMRTGVYLLPPGTQSKVLGEDAVSTKVLEQEYTIWDRKFGDPRLLTDDHPQAPSKYDGRLSGNWTFPFSIPFPSRADGPTLCTVYPEESEGPIRFLPEPLLEDSPFTPFDLGGDPTGIIQPSLDTTPASPSNIAPFDIRMPHTLTEKGRLGSAEPETLTEVSAPPSFAPIVSSSPTAPSVPSVEPYMQISSEGSNGSEKSGHPPPHHTPTTNRRWRPRGATRMQDIERLASATERRLTVSVQYELTLTITHGRLSTKSRVSTPIIYTPVTVPPTMTLGRQRAYQQRQIPPSPDLDPDGWKQVSPVSIRGTFNDQTALAVNYTLYLAAPLSYARVIPLYLTISCDDDVGALNLFADPRTPRVRLRRSTRVSVNQPLGTEGATSPRWDGIPNASNPHGLPGIEPFITTADGEDEEETLGPSDETDGQEIGAAVWCTPANLTHELQERRLYGEIRLPRELQPTCKFPLFNILVSELQSGGAWANARRLSTISNFLHPQPMRSYLTQTRKRSCCFAKPKQKRPATAEKGSAKIMCISRNP
ncbi:hypothetical protein FA13DRAFT_1727124 [Coprinellus micaceus]|uniref:Arrestin-like N-terminal domain-containing protein n=1 Tax=Coprinellus micaceus TaxID=71717 RepID=A0A4Y7TT87_COPMI|nr:hypothetical protein FA13DRAFT_1727124 [Coprinellus micaceus]